MSYVISRWRGQETKPIRIIQLNMETGSSDRIHKRSLGVMPAVGHGSRIDLINRKPNAVQPNKPELPVLGVGSSGVSRTRLLGNNANLNWSWPPMCVRCSVLQLPVSARRARRREDRCEFIALPRAAGTLSAWIQILHGLKQLEKR